MDRKEFEKFISQKNNNKSFFRVVWGDPCTPYRKWVDAVSYIPTKGNIIYSVYQYPHKYAVKVYYPDDSSKNLEISVHTEEQAYDILKKIILEQPIIL